MKHSKPNACGLTCRAGGLLAVAAGWILTSSALAAPWGFEAVCGLAEQASKVPFKPDDPLPDSLKQLSYDDLRSIRYAPNESIWRMEHLPFQLQCFHPGGLQKDRVLLNEVEGEVITPVPFSPDRFEYKETRIRGRMPDDVGYSGFRIHYPLNKPDYLDELVVFQGASYFRALCRGASYGLSARSLGLQTAEGDIEEFPRFRQFWVEKPDRAGERIRVWGLLDSASAAGAVEFVITPGVMTVVDVRISVFFRSDVKTLGIAPLTSMFWYGENSMTRFGDFRPEIHDSDGVVVHTGKNEWLWRPLASDTNKFRYSAFSDEHLYGYGLCQRDRRFEAYEDLEALYHSRPSVWVEPATTNGWGPGELRLIELPPNFEYGDNVNLFWVPRAPVRAGDRVDYAYRLNWYLENREWPPLARVVATRLSRPLHNPRAVRFVLDFTRHPAPEGVTFKDLKLEVSADRGNVLGTFLQANDFSGTWRVFFDVEAHTDTMPVELQCRLLTADRPLTETWVYQWSPSGS